MLSALPAQAVSVINTVTSWNNSDVITIFGSPDTATYGQTVTTPAVDNVLNSFSFILGSALGGGGSPITFQGYVAQWDGTKATGPILYQSANQTYSGGGFQTYNFNTGSLALTPSQKYVLFLNVSDFSVTGTTGQAFIYNSNTYTGGDFVAFNNGDDFGLLTTNSWDFQEGAFGDTAFTASFSSPTPVPLETDALPVLGSTIFFGLGIWGKRKRDQQRILKS